MSYDNEYSEFWQGYSKDGDDIASLVKRISAMGGSMESLIMDVKQNLEGDISEAYSLISQTADEIRHEVFERIESVEGEVQTNYSLIQQNANNISLKVSQTDYNGNTIASLINQTATSVLIRANRIDFVGSTSFTLGDGSYGRTDIDGGGVFTDYLWGREVRADRLFINNRRLDYELIGGSGEYGLTIGGIPLAYSSRYHYHSVSENTTGSHNHGGNTGTGGAHNHGIPNGTRLATTDGGYVTWSIAGNHTHGITSDGNHRHNVSIGNAQG